MINIKKIRKQFGGNVCRQCINKEYGIHLLHTDCQYGMMYPGKCPCCGDMKNIVTGIKLSGFFKSFGARKGKYTK